MKRSNEVSINIENLSPNFDGEEMPENTQPVSQQSPSIFPVAIELFCALFVFNFILKLDGHTTPEDVDEELVAQNMLKWLVANIGGAITMQSVKGCNELFSLMQDYKNQLKNGDTENLVEIKNKLLSMPIRWLGHCAAAWSGFNIFNLNSVTYNITYSNHTWFLASIRAVNSLVAVVVMNFFHNLVEKRETQWMVFTQLLAALFTVPYNEQISAEVLSLFDELSPLAEDLLQLLIEATAPALAATFTGLAYKSTKNIGNLLGGAAKNCMSFFYPLSPSPIPLQPEYTPINGSAFEYK